MAPCVPDQGIVSLAKIERRRAQTRTRQLRYLQKKRQYESDLKTSVAALYSEVGRLQQHLHQAQNAESHHCSATTSSPSATASSNILLTVRNFVHCFQSTIHVSWLPCSSPNQGQTHFVQQSIHPDVQHGELRSRNSFLEQWRRYTTFFSPVLLHEHNIELLRHPIEPMCRVELTMSLGLTTATFQNVFPHLLQLQHSALLNRLMNQQIHVQMTLLLQFDAQGRIVRYDPSLNFIEALRPLLTSYDDVSTVLQDARTSSCGHISSARDARLSLSFVLNVE